MARLRRIGSYYIYSTATREYRVVWLCHTVMVIAVLRPYDVINAFELGWPALP
jgi:hypothetical protein